jgi:GNAT superfamily N-acetyltransferase
MRAEAGSRRWVLINVAVLPAWRRRGIASALVQGCLDEARRRAGRELWLQVDAANTGARDLYHRLGFRLTGVRATWRRTPWHSDSSASSEARARRPEEADDQLRLAERLCPEGVLWPLPLDRDTFRRSAPWGAIGHWVWPVGGPMQGFLSAFPGYETGGVQWVMMVDPQARGRAEGPLLDRALADWPHRARQMRLDTADESDGAILRSRGFTLERRLAWMTTNLAVPAEGSVPPEAGGGQHDDGG